MSRFYVRYLRNRHRSERETERALRDWRIRKLDVLQTQWGNLRRQRRNDEAELLIPEIERLKIVLGIAAQQDMGL